MGTTYILFNPLADNGKCKEHTEKLKKTYEDAVMINMMRINDYSSFFDGLEKDDNIVICGGDGTLNCFINDTEKIKIKNKIYYYAVGTGNDFSKDIGHNKFDAPDFTINEYIENLPSVTVNGKRRLFINGVGYGIDGYCCEVGDKLRKENETQNKNRKINYTTIAIKGLLFHFKPRNATVTIDGEKYDYKKVWLAPTMNGRYYGGGMIPTPKQDRLRKDRKCSFMVFYGSNKIKTLMIFPSIFKGEHVEHTKNVKVLEGQSITVEFDQPTALQIDGETILDVTSYSVNI